MKGYFYRFFHRLIFQTALLLIPTSVFIFVTCTLNTPEPNSSDQTIGQGALVGMFEIQNIKSNTNEITQRNPLSASGSHDDANRFEGSDQKIQNNDIQVHIKNMGNGETYTVDIKDGFYLLKNLSVGKYRIYTVSHTRDGVDYNTALTYDFTIARNSIRVLPRIRMYRGIRLLSTNSPASRHSLNFFAYPADEPETYIDQNFTTEEEKELRVLR